MSTVITQLLPCAKTKKRAEAQPGDLARSSFWLYGTVLEMSRRSAVAMAPGPGRYHGFSAMKLPLGSPEQLQLNF